MRILWIKTELLHPVDKGGRIRTYQMLRSLARKHEVTYLCLDDGQAAPDAKQRAVEYCTKLVTVPFSAATKGGLRFFGELLVNLLSPLPYAVARYRSAQLESEIRRLADQSDLVICDFLAPALNVPDGLPTPTVLFQHNVEAMIWERHAAVPQSLPKRLFMRLQAHRMRRFEAAQCRRFISVVAVSRADALEMEHRYGRSGITDVSTGVDLEYFSPLPAVKRSPNELVFVGSMDWLPNQDGISWFIESIFPELRRRVPGVRLLVVGRTPPAELRALAERVGDVEVTGTVDDVRPYLARAAISIVPLRIGGGTRLKIYEAMAMGAPIVSTRVGAEGLPLQHGEHLLLADSPQEQVTAIESLLRDAHAASELAARAGRYVQANGSWGAIADQFVNQTSKTA
ncbi:MAG: glycosyltransferase [Proteobacteria bacterium]|nr:glycosyltransferase [Pseudomonadota bacterium]